MAFEKRTCFKLKEFIKKAPEGVVFKIHAHAGKTSFKITGFSEWRNALEIDVVEMPEKGKANLEIEKKLSEFFQTKCKITSGFSSKNKKVLAETSAENIENALKHANSQRQF